MRTLLAHVAFSLYLILQLAKNGTSVDGMNSNGSRGFLNTSLMKAGLSDCQKLTVSFFRAFDKRIPQSYENYRSLIVSSMIQIKNHFKKLLYQ